MVGGWVIERQFQKFFKRYSVVNLAFQFSVRVDIYPVGPEDRTGAKVK